MSPSMVTKKSPVVIKIPSVVISPDGPIIATKRCNTWLRIRMVSGFAKRKKTRALYMLYLAFNKTR